MKLWRPLASLTLFLAALLATTEPNEAATITVGPGQSIQAAVNAAAAGDTVRVQAGVHAEQVSITKRLTLQGDSGAVIDGSCSREFGVFIGTPSVTDVVVRGFEIRNTRGSGVRIENDDDAPMSQAPRNITVDDNYIHDFWCNQSGDPFGVAGVSSWYGGPNITITDNTIKYRGALSDTASGQRSDADGIFFGSTNSRPSGGGHYVARNRIVGGWDGLGGGDEAEVAGTLHKNSTVENNVIMTCDDDGIQAEGGGQNVRIRNNTISGCLIGIAIASPQTGPTYVEGNVISGLFNACYKVGNGPGTGVTYLTGNRCTGPKGMQQTDPNHVSLVLRQNCWNQGGYIFELPYGPTSGLDFDEDVMYSTGTPFKWNGGVTYGSLAAFQAATGDELNGVWSQTCSGGGPTPTLTPSPTPTPPPPASCTAPTILSTTDTNPSGGGIVGFSWSAVNGASTYRITRRSGTSWVGLGTTANRSWSGTDPSDDPEYRVYVATGTCTPTPGPATTFDPSGFSAQCAAPTIESTSDTNSSGGGTVTFSWGAVPGASTYRITRRSGTSWVGLGTTANRSWSGTDPADDPDYRVYLATGTCTPVPGPATTFDP